jgi:hypothetical protein
VLPHSGAEPLAPVEIPVAQPPLAALLGRLAGIVEPLTGGVKAVRVEKVAGPSSVSCILLAAVRLSQWPLRR